MQDRRRRSWWSEPATRTPSPALTAARFGAVVLAVLAAVTFGSLLVEGDFDIARAPVAYLVPAVALLIATVVSRRRPTAAAWIVGLCALGLLVAFVVALLREGVPDHWAVSLFVLAGTPVAAAVLLVTPAALGR